MLPPLLYWLLAGIGLVALTTILMGITGRHSRQELDVWRTFADAAGGALVIRRRWPAYFRTDAWVDIPHGTALIVLDRYFESPISSDGWPFPVARMRVGQPLSRSFDASITRAGAFTRVSRAIHLSGEVATADPAFAREFRIAGDSEGVTDLLASAEVRDAFRKGLGEASFQVSKAGQVWVAQVDDITDPQRLSELLEVLACAWDQLEGRRAH